MSGTRSFFFLSVCLFALGHLEDLEGLSIEEESGEAKRDAQDYPDYHLGVRYDEYPVSILTTVLDNFI